MNGSPHTQLDPQTMAALTAAADARGLSVEQYVRAIAPMPSESPGDTVELDDVDRWLDELAAPVTAGGGSLPADFSRADIYCNHD